MGDGRRLQVTLLDGERVLHPSDAKVSVTLTNYRVCADWQDSFTTFTPDPSCGPPLDVSIHTASGFLYGGHVPEPSSLLLLAAPVGFILRRRRHVERR